MPASGYYFEIEVECVEWYALVASLVGFFGFGVFTAMNPNTKRAVFWRTVAETSADFTDKLFSGGKIRSIRVFGDSRDPVRCDEVGFRSTDTAGPVCAGYGGHQYPKEIEMTTVSSTWFKGREGRLNN